MTTDNNTNPAAGANEGKESAMSILEKRLAEINAKKSGQPVPSEAPTIAPEIKTESQPAPAPAASETKQPETAKPASQETSETIAPTPVPVSEPASQATATQTEHPSPDPAEAGFPVTEAPESNQTESEKTIATTAKPVSAEGKLEEVTGENVSLQEPVEATFVVSAVENFPTDTALHALTEENQPAKSAETEPEKTETTAPVTASVSSASQGNETPAAMETSEEEVAAEEEALAEEDYASLTLPELTQRLQRALKEPNAHKNARKMFALHRQYDQMMQLQKAEAHQQFVAEGGASDDFAYRLNPEQQEIEKGMQQLRENRARDQRQEEEQKVKNLQRKQELVSELRELVEGAESRNSADRLKTIQAEWKAIGPVPQAEAQQLWKSYHALLDIYYNNRSIFFELKELDRKRNYDAKLQLCDRAEALVNEPSINKSLHELRHLHEEWKNIGPVPNDVKDTIWDRFIQASEKVHQRKKEYLAGKQEAEQANLLKKQEILTRLEPFAAISTDRINDWREKTDEIQKIKEEWDAVGLVPKDEADTINKKFWGTYKAFYQHKNQFFKSLDDQKMNNLRLKTELCEQAEALKDSTDWNGTKEKLIQLQKKWKTIGRVPDKHSEPIWQRFRAACNEFFDRKQNESKQREEELDRLSTEKNNVCDELASRLTHAANNEPGTMEEYQVFIDKWDACSTTEGKVSGKLEERFNNLLEKYLDNIPDLTYDHKNDLLFQLQVNKLRSGPDSGQKIHQKQQQIRREIQQLENDIHTLKTNIEFFSKSKNAEKLREEYDGRIAEARTRIEMLQKQLKSL